MLDECILSENTWELKMAKDKNKKTYRDRITALADEFDGASKRYVDMRDAQETAITTESRALTDEENTARAEAKADRDALADRISAMREERALAKNVAEARRDAGLDDDVSGHGHAEVISEPRTYGPGSPNSNFAD